MDPSFILRSRVNALDVLSDGFIKLTEVIVRQKMCLHFLLKIRFYQRPLIFIVENLFLYAFWLRTRPLFFFYFFFFVRLNSVCSVLMRSVLAKIVWAVGFFFVICWIFLWKTEKSVVRCFLFVLIYSLFLLRLLNHYSINIFI